MSYVDEYRGLDAVKAPVEFEGKPQISYSDFLYNHHRLVLIKQWVDINRQHNAFGCPLIPAKDGTWSPCVIHGTGEMEQQPLTRDQYLGSFKENRERF